jgi:8-oxo-dGTP diphosphatase
MSNARGNRALDSRPLVDVVCAVLQKPDGEFLLAQRPEGKVCAGYWEFPGGKVDPGESLAEATARELVEELGIVVEQSYPWLTRIFSYPHANVRLHFRRVTQWRNEPRGRENQAFSWQSVSNIKVAPLLPANGPILQALALPVLYGITHADELGEAVMLERLRTTLAKGLQLIQVREKAWTAEKLAAFAQQVIDIASESGARVLVNSDIGIAHSLNATGVHLNSKQLMVMDTRPDVRLCAASCHDERELRHAADIGMDFVVLGPVLPTPSHPHAMTLGWNKFGELAQHYSVPIFAIGGLNENHLETAWQHGAHGVAMLRNAWLV